MSTHDTNAKGEAKARDPLVGYMILESYCEDMSEWDGVITGPQDPTGANLAWENPIKMIEFSAYERLREENERLKEQALNVLQVAHQEGVNISLIKERDQLKQECEGAMNTAEELHKYVASTTKRAELAEAKLKRAVEGLEDLGFWRCGACEENMKVRDKTLVEIGETGP